MNKINFLTAGESHGQGLLGIIDGIPAGLDINDSYINCHLSRRQKGFGRGGRMKIENDQVDLFFFRHLQFYLRNYLNLLLFFQEFLP